MKLKASIGLFLLFMLFSCNQHASKTGLKISYKPTRGQSYTDAQGNTYNLRHIPARISSDSSVSIQLEISFEKEYDYPAAFDEEQFRIFPMPKGWALDGIDITDSMLQELQQYIDEPLLTINLAPDEEFLLGFGILYPRNINYGVFPLAVFSHDQRDLQHECRELMDPAELSIPHSSLQLLMGFTDGSQASPDSCMSISFAQISYPEN